MSDEARLAWLECLEAAGVDNWEGIEFAHQMYRDSYPQFQDEEDL